MQSGNAVSQEPLRISIREALEDQSKRLYMLRHRVSCLRVSLLGTTRAESPETITPVSVEDKIFAQGEVIHAIEESVGMLLSRFGVDDSIANAEAKPRDLGRCAR